MSAYLWFLTSSSDADIVVQALSLDEKLIMQSLYKVIQASASQLNLVCSSCNM